MKSPSPFPIHKPRLRTIDIDDLIPHEDIEIQRLTRILQSIKLYKVLRKPIIIEQRKGIVIDGHHRLKALMLLGIREIPVVVANYNIDILQIGSWMYVGHRGIPSFKDVITFVETLEGISKHGDANIMIKVGDYMYSANVDRIDVYYALKSINDIKRLWLAKMPANMGRCLEHDICIVMPRLTIDDVYRVGLRGEVLPPRTTLHVTPLKSINIFYPIKII